MSIKPTNSSYLRLLPLAGILGALVFLQAGCKSAGVGARAGTTHWARHAGEPEDPGNVYNRPGDVIYGEVYIPFDKKDRDAIANPPRELDVDRIMKENTFR